MHDQVDGVVEQGVFELERPERFRREGVERCGLVFVTESGHGVDFDGEAGVLGLEVCVYQGCLGEGEGGAAGANVEGSGGGGGGGGFGGWHFCYLVGY